MSFLNKLKDTLGFNEGTTNAPLVPALDFSKPSENLQDTHTPLPPDSYDKANSVNGTFENAIRHAKKHRRFVQVDLNGVEGMLVDAQSTVHSMMEVYNGAQKLLREQGAAAVKRFLEDTPEHQRHYQAMYGTRAHRAAMMQQHMDTLLADLPKRLEDGRDSTIAWIGAFAKAANDLQVGFNYQQVIAALQGAGYSKELAHDQSQTATGLGNRIIGTSLQQLEDTHTIHPGMSKQCVEYVRLAKRERISIEEKLGMNKT